MSISFTRFDTAQFSIEILLCASTSVKIQLCVDIVTTDTLNRHDSNHVFNLMMQQY